MLSMYVKVSIQDELADDYIRVRYHLIWIMIV